MKQSMFARFAREEDGAVPLEPFDNDDLMGRFRRAVSRSIQAVSELSGKARAGAEPAQDKDAKRQRQRQAKEIRTCEIHFDGNSISGMVLNLSDGGAEVRLPEHLSALPKFFTLKLPPGRTYDCEIRWRDRDKVGVSFV